MPQVGLDRAAPPSGLRHAPENTRPPARLLGRLRESGAAVAAVVPLTGRGALLSALCGASLWYYGYGALDLVVFVLGAAGLVLVLLCGASVVATAVLVRREQRHAAAAAAGGAIGCLEGGTEVETGFDARSLRRWPVLELDWTWLTPSGVTCTVFRQRDRYRERVLPRARGEASAVVRRFTVRDAFGLTAFTWECEHPGPVWILPERGGLRRIQLLHSFASADGISHPAGDPAGDRMEIRRYVPGDSTRHIMWKAYARSGQLNIRTPERSFERAERTLAYLVAGPDDEAAAAAARVALEGDSLGREWIFGADGTDEPLDELGPALRAIARSAAVRSRERGGQGLRAFLDRVGSPSDIGCVVFAPGRPGPWTDIALAVAREHGGPMSFVLATDGVAHPAAPEPLWRRALYAAPPTAVVPAEVHAELVARIVAAGCMAHVVDRPSGREFRQRVPSALRQSA